MRALTFRGKRDIALESVPDPALVQPTDAIVRVELTAICGSDLHVYHERERPDIGTVMGHEFVGEIVEVGRDVRERIRGERVLSPFTTSCGACYYCARGLTARCSSGQLFGFVQQGEGLHGAQAEYVRVPLADSTLVPMPEGVSPKEALLLGDVLSTGFFCARNADVSPGGTYAVVGCGPVGLMAIVGARELGAERLFAVDTIPERISLAGRFGAETIDFAHADAAEVVRAATDGRGADAVLEVVGSPAAGRTALDLVRPGGTISVVGVHNEDRFAFSPGRAYDLNLTYRVGRCPARAILEELIPVVRRKTYDLSAVFTHVLPLEHGPQAYALFDGKRDGCIKVILDPTAG